ncbi:MAG TPA: GTPase, partial [Sphingomonas sp.]|nr:GTPase [Sphingomonas sp.]
PPIERLRAGINIVIAGPPNSGKSTLINLLAEREVAIVSPISGTTRDRLEAPVSRAGLAYVLTDTAGLADRTDDAIERIGIDRASAAIGAADLLLWLGDDPPPRAAIWVHARADQAGRETIGGKDVAISALDASSIDRLWMMIESRAQMLVPAIDAVALNRRQRTHAEAAVAALKEGTVDLLLTAEQLRVARRELGAILGIDVGEQLLDTLFSKFCIGK